MSDDKAKRIFEGGSWSPKSANLDRDTVQKSFSPKASALDRTPAQSGSQSGSSTATTPPSKKND